MKLFTLYLIFLINLGNCASSSNTEAPEPEDALPAGYTKEILSAPKLVQGTTFSVGSKLIFDSNGYLRTAVLGSDQTILDEKYKKDFPHIFKKQTIIQYKEPKTTFGDAIKFPEIPKMVTIRKPMEIFGYSFGPASSFTFPTEGKKPYIGIAVERTFYDIDIKGKKIPSGSTVLFEDKDKLKVLIKGIWEEPGTVRP